MKYTITKGKFGTRHSLGLISIEKEEVKWGKCPIIGGGFFYANVKIYWVARVLNRYGKPGGLGGVQFHTDTLRFAKEQAEDYLYKRETLEIKDGYITERTFNRKAQK